MKIKVSTQNNQWNLREKKSYFSCLKTLSVAFVLSVSSVSYAQIGTWAKVATKPANENMGIMLLMTDGTVMCHNATGQSYGTGWDKLTPNATGSYVNGTWSSGGSMKYDRLFFSSQVLPNGKLFVAGGEYGSGDTAGEIYNPVTNTWSGTEGVVSKMNIYDGNSEILPNGNVMVGLQSGTDPSFNDQFYTPGTNKWSTAPTAPLNHDEAAWVKLPDSSILFVGIGGTATCRYEPKTNTWITDAATPVDLYDTYGEEAGSAVLMPNGKVIFFGATGHNCIYTPTGTTAKGSWVAAPDFPTIGGSITSMDDAPSAMMVNGHILCGVGPAPTSSNNEFLSPLYFVEYDYLTNAFTQVTSTIPGIGADDIAAASSYQANLLDLPDGTVLMSYDQNGTPSEQYYIYTPGSAAIAQGKPTINSILPDGCPYYKLTGKLFNGISEGAQYGDDAQNSTNYPLVRLTNAAGDVYYCKTTLWNRIGAVMTDSAEDTTVFETPATLPAGTYSLVVVANGFASNPTIFSTLGETATVTSAANCGGTTGIASSVGSGGLSPYTYSWTGGGGTNSTATGLSAGTYTVTITDNNGCTSTAAVTITQSSSLGLSAVISSNITCNGMSDGIVSASINGGSSPYTYAWTGGSTNSSISGLSAGVYTVQVTDKNGCEGTSSVTLTQPALLSASGNVTSESACLGNNGSASATVTGGTTPYTYSWTGGGSNSTVSGLSAGTYIVDVTDNGGCTASSSVTITQSSGISSVSAIASNVKCNGENDGSATATVSGGTGPYTYSWTGGGTSATDNGLSAGTYTLSVTDKNGCSGTTTAVITQPKILSSTTYTTAATNSKDCDGEAAVTASGGTSPYTYSWSGGAGTTDTIKGQCAGNYCCTITDNNGCMESTCVTIPVNTTGVADINNASNINIYPQPNSGSFTVAGVVRGQVIELYNILGQQISSVTADQANVYFNIANQADGVYLVRILDRDGSLVTQKKIVKAQ